MGKDKLKRYPKLHYFDGSSMRYIRVNRLSNFFILKLLEIPYVTIEGKTMRERIPQKVFNAIKRVAEKRKLLDKLSFHVKVKMSKSIISGL